MSSHTVYNRISLKSAEVGLNTIDAFSPFWKQDKIC